MATRRYEQRARAEEAEKTRQRIVDAALERLRDAPSEPVSMERIATMAGVARSTVYAIFGSRAGLFDAVGVELRERGGYDRLVEASHDADARAALRGGIRAASEMLAGEPRQLPDPALDGEAGRGGRRRLGPPLGGGARRRDDADRRAARTSRATSAPA